MRARPILRAGAGTRASCRGGSRPPAPRRQPGSGGAGARARMRRGAVQWRPPLGGGTVRRSRRGPRGRQAAGGVHLRAARRAPRWGPMAGRRRRPARGRRRIAAARRAAGRGCRAAGQAASGAEAQEAWRIRAWLRRLGRGRRRAAAHAGLLAGEPRGDWGRTKRWGMRDGGLGWVGRGAGGGRQITSR